ncbi:unnamed protein product [Pleuronectes platessa]|uniref:Uncharacterized protein n=1 Tax=Pleuronectes platessa TaxID=8262 RepID=A0A9N7VGG5_PLEPL|nr:unnamed protein product [Pleuronectes platessa]
MVMGVGLRAVLLKFEGARIALSLTEPWGPDTCTALRCDNEKQEEAKSRFLMADVFRSHSSRDRVPQVSSSISTPPPPPHHRLRNLFPSDCQPSSGDNPIWPTSVFLREDRKEKLVNDKFTPRLPLHLSANDLLEPAMPPVHLCLPPQIELFDTRRLHATTRKHKHAAFIPPDIQSGGVYALWPTCILQDWLQLYTYFLGGGDNSSMGLLQATPLLRLYLRCPVLPCTRGTHATRRWTPLSSLAMK